MYLPVRVPICICRGRNAKERVYAINDVHFALIASIGDKHIWSFCIYLSTLGTPTTVYDQVREEKTHSNTKYAVHVTLIVM